MTAGVFLFAAGLTLLILGAELVVRGASRLATMLGVSPMIIGLTIVAVGTSTPELAVGVTAAWRGTGALAVGNIAGTNVFNLLFILGLSALMWPLPLNLQIFKLELPMIVFAAVLMIVLGWDSVLSRLDGGLMLAAAVVYTLLLVDMTRRASRRAKKEFQEEYGPQTIPAAPPAQWRRSRYVATLAAGMALTVFGAELFVRGAVDIARKFDVSETIIGLTVVAIGTSGPELVTAIVATLKDDRDVAVGNLLGSSIYNILVILGLTCLVSPDGLPVERQLMLFDIPLMACVTLGAVPVFVTGKRISRMEGGLGVAAYLVYLAWLMIYRT